MLPFHIYLIFLSRKIIQAYKLNLIIFLQVLTFYYCVWTQRWPFKIIDRSIAQIDRLNAHQVLDFPIYSIAYSLSLATFSMMAVNFYRAACNADTV